MTLTCAESLITNAWYPKAANVTLSGLDLTNTTHYALRYLCTWTGSKWKADVETDPTLNPIGKFGKSSCFAGRAGKTR